MSAGNSTTNVKPSQLNYERYSIEKYDRDIVNSIPFHREIHELVVGFLSKRYSKNKTFDVLDLGVGTGLTSSVIKELLPSVKFDVVDFSRQMLGRAEDKLGNKNVRYILGDYSKLQFGKRYDLIVSVIGIHHQTDQGKRLLFKKIYSLLKPDGVFIFGDLVTYRNKHKAALNEAMHFHHLVKNSVDTKTLIDWAYHHKFLNSLAPIEDQIDWLKEAGFENPKVVFNEFNTALIIAQKY